MRTYDKEVNNEADAREFFRWLTAQEGLAWHPDEQFEDYVDRGTGRRVYTDEEAQRLNGVMTRCFQVLKDKDVLRDKDIYQIGMDEVSIATADDRMVGLSEGMTPEQASRAIKHNARVMAGAAAYWYGRARGDAPEHIALRLELQLKRLLSVADV